MVQEDIENLVSLLKKGKVSQEELILSINKIDFKSACPGSIGKQAKERPLDCGKHKVEERKLLRTFTLKEMQMVPLNPVNALNKSMKKLEQMLEAGNGLASSSKKWRAETFILEDPLEHSDLQHVNSISGPIINEGRNVRQHLYRTCLEEAKICCAGKPNLYKKVMDKVAAKDINTSYNSKTHKKGESVQCDKTELKNSIISSRDKKKICIHTHREMTTIIGNEKSDKIKESIPFPSSFKRLALKHLTDKKHTQVKCSIKEHHAKETHKSLKLVNKSRQRIVAFTSSVASLKKNSENKGMKEKAEPSNNSSHRRIAIKQMALKVRNSLAIEPKPLSTKEGTTDSSQELVKNIKTKGKGTKETYPRINSSPEFDKMNPCKMTFRKPQTSFNREGSFVFKTGSTSKKTEDIIKKLHEQINDCLKIVGTATLAKKKLPKLK